MPIPSVGDHVTIRRPVDPTRRRRVDDTGVVAMVQPAIRINEDHVYLVRSDKDLARVAAYEVEPIDAEAFKWDPDTTTLSEYLDDAQLARAAALLMASELLPEHTSTEDVIAAADWVEAGLRSFVLEGTEAPDAESEEPINTVRVPGDTLTLSPDTDGDYAMVWPAGPHRVAVRVVPEIGSSATSLLTAAATRDLHSYLTAVLEGN